MSLNNDRLVFDKGRKDNKINIHWSWRVQTQRKWKRKK